MPLLSPPFHRVSPDFPPAFVPLYVCTIFIREGGEHCSLRGTERGTSGGDWWVWRGSERGDCVQMERRRICMCVCCVCVGVLQFHVAYVGVLRDPLT